VNCDWIAPYYRWFEYLGFGAELERRRFCLLDQVRRARRVLVLGDGDGRFLARLAREIPEAEIDSVEASARMQRLARRRSRDCARVNHLLGDARSLTLARREYGLIVTHFFLDCFEAGDAEALVARISDAAAPGAQWLISEFRRAARGWRAVWCNTWIAFLYFFFRVATGLKTRVLVDHHPLLARHGFRLVRQETSRFGLLSSELWQR